MADDLEARFRAACAAYLDAAEQVDQDRARAETAAMVLRGSEHAADQARDAMLQVVRERDAAAQLAAAAPATGVTAVLGPDGKDTGATIIGDRMHPSDRAQTARDRWLAEVAAVGGTVTWMTPQEGSQRWHNMIGAGVCPECGILWILQSPDCPKRVFDRHPR